MRRALGLAIVVSMATAGAASPAVDLDAKCRRQIGIGARKLVEQAVKEKVRCYQRQFLGRVPGTVECNDLDDPSFPGRRAMDRARQKLEDLVAAGCAGAAPPSANGYPRCLPPCETSVVAAYTGANGVSACLQCVAESQTDAAVAAIYGAPPLMGTAMIKCQANLGKGLRTYLRARMKQQQLCRFEEESDPDQAEIDCRVVDPASDPRGKVGAAADAMRRMVGHCDLEALAALDTCGEGVTEVHECLEAAGVAAGDTLYDQLYRGAECASRVLSATGQATTYPADKNDGVAGPVAVADDGALRMGAALSFTDNGDGTITDLSTGLMWEKKDDAAGLHDKDNEYPWSGDGTQETIWDWLDDVNSEGGAGFAGYDDWRIPNKKELESIVHYASWEPAVAPEFDAGCVPGCTAASCSCAVWNAALWSSSTAAGDPGRAWVALYADGGTFLFPLSSPKGTPNRVRAVRGGGSTCPVPISATGQTTSYPADKNDGLNGPVAVPDDGAVRAGTTLSFRDNGDGTITDLNTGLMWEKKDDAGGLHDKDNVYQWSGDGSRETIWDWLDDLNAEGGSGFAGYDDWRAPNVRELLSLVDVSRRAPAVTAAFDSGCAPGCSVLTCSCTVSGTFFSSYLTSTTVARVPVFAVTVGFEFGDSGGVIKTLVNDVRVRAVRGGT